MLKKLLIANRGEIAVRIIRAAEELQIKTVAVYSTADKDALHVKLADEAICIGGARSVDSYLQMEAILTAAVASKCDAIHPGYGFLAESAVFAQRVEELGLKFVGPEAKTIALMGDKIAARRLMEEVGVPVVPGSPDELKDADEAFSFAEQIGYPVLIKAASGGGGKGMRKVYSSTELKQQFIAAQTEAKAAFGDGAMYLEKLIIEPRHIEVQILADGLGNIISLGERNCSIQHKNQKMIEEAPCYDLTTIERKALEEAAIKTAKACDYKNAGTVEFIMDKSRAFYFIEMNTRIQVEHPVTEMVTGVDLVKEQLKVASGLRLSYQQEDIQISGHALECRVVAVEPLKDFMPQSGNIEYLFAPGGVETRFDTHLFTGANISPYYDAMIGKIIVHDKTRLQAIRKMRRAIEETTIQGVATNLYLLYTIIHDFDFIKGQYDTSFMQKKITKWLAVMEATADGLLEAAETDI